MRGALNKDDTEICDAGGQMSKSWLVQQTEVKEDIKNIVNFPGRTELFRKLKAF